MVRTEVHVVPYGDKWAVKRELAERPIVFCDTKEKALVYARVYSKRSGAEMIIHTLDGRIQNPNSYGNDPCPPRDKVH